MALPNSTALPGRPGQKKSISFSDDNRFEIKSIDRIFCCGERHERQLQLAELVEGYAEFADFDARQLRWVEALRTMRLVHYAAWLARRWQDPAFPRSFTWFNTGRYWADHILELREQLAALQEEPLQLL